MLRAVAPLFVVAFFVPALFVAFVLPYRYWDSLAFGTWSRLIAETGTVFSRHVFDISLHRPLFYVAQGLLWRTFGDHWWIGRWLSVAFGGALVLGVWLLAGRVLDGSRELVRPLAVGAILGSSVFAAYVAAGMADVPVAATAALAAAALWSRRLGRARLPLVALAAAATVLAKPNGLFALAGLVLATVVMLRRDRLSGLIAAAVGATAALSLDAVNAHRVGDSLYAFLRAGNGDYWLARGRAARADAVLRADWLGEGTRPILLFGLVYAVARVAGARTRLALGLAAPIAIVWSIAGPIAADDHAPYPFAHVGLGTVAYVLVAASLVAAPFVAREDPIARRTYAALLLWAAPAVVAWLAYRADATRFLSPAWPALVLLAAAALAAVAGALATVRPELALAPVGAVALVLAANLPAIDGLGRSGWRGLLELGPDGWTSKAQAENYAYGPFSYELIQARENVARGDRIVTNDARLTYFFPGRVEVTYPHACAELSRARFVALLTSGDSAAFAKASASPIEPLAWVQCKQPRVELIGEEPGIYADFVVGGKPSRPSTPEDCRITSYSAELDDAILAADVGYAKARRVQRRASAVGFQQARIDQTSCSTFRVVVRGFPTTTSGQADFRSEATRTGFDVTFAPAVRYPEVPADVRPAR